MRSDRKKQRTLLAVGSVVDICPAGDYSEYLPKGTISQRLGASWKEAGRYLNKAISRNAAISR